jgi:hypothetical protein
VYAYTFAYTHLYDRGKTFYSACPCIVEGGKPWEQSFSGKKREKIKTPLYGIDQTKFGKIFHYLAPRVGHSQVTTAQ